LESECNGDGLSKVKFRVRVWHYPIERVPELDVAHSNRLCPTILARDFQVFATPHGKEKGHVYKVLESPSYGVFCL
jgi:hypothetical protein